MPKRLFYILLVCTLSRHVTAQTVDTSFNEDALNAVNIYYQSLGAESPLYNGSEYVEYTYTLQDGNPFFQSDAWTNGDIVLDGMNFHDVPMLYDIVKDQVIIRDFQKAYKINIPADKIQQFKLSGHTFIRITHNSPGQVKTGFYDQLYNGKIAVYARREKKIIEKYGGLQISNVIEQKNIYYVKRDSVYYTIKNKRALLDALNDKKKAIQQYLKKIQVKFKDDPETVMILVAEYYDKLTN
jgi:hypothetical protein